MRRVDLTLHFLAKNEYTIHRAQKNEKTQGVFGCHLLKYGKNFSLSAEREKNVFSEKNCDFWVNL